MQRPPASNALVVPHYAVSSSYVEPAAEDGAFALDEIFRILRRRIATILLIFTLVLAAGGAFIMLAPPRYQATALLQVGPPDSRNAESRMPGPEYVQSQVELLSSRPTITRLARALDNSAPSSALLSKLQRSIDVRRQDQSYIIQVTATADNPHQAAQYANGLAAAYFDLREQAARTKGRALRDEMSKRLASMQTEVQQRDLAVLEYRRAHNLSFIAENDDSSAELAVMRAALGQARGEVAEMQTRAAESQSGRMTGGQPEIAKLREQETEVTQRLADLSQKYGDKHPTMQATRAELESVRRQIAAENARQSAALAVSARAAQARLATLEASFAAARSTGTTEELATLAQLQREAQVARAVFEDQMKRFNEIGVSGAPEAGAVQLVAEASDAPNVAPQHRLSSLALLAVLAATVAALIAYLLEQFDRRLTSSEDIPRLLGLPLLASIPALSKRDLKKLPPKKAQPVGFLEQNSHSSFAEALRVLWVNLSHGPAERRPKTVVVTSALPGEGKTSTSLCLARTAVGTRSRVVVVDCDLRRRSLNYLLGLEPRRGVVDVLNGLCTIEDAIGHDPLSGADILPATAKDHDASDLFGSSAMRTLLKQLSERYDLVILDSAPVLPFADSRTLASIADGAIIVTRNRKSDSFASRAAASYLENVGAKILGVVFNAVSQKPLGRRSYADSVYFDYAKRKAYKAYT